MLYVTTRGTVDAYTAQRVLRDRRGPDGGLYVPFRLPSFSQEEILALGQKNFNTCVADALNLLFNTRLTGYDIDFTAGRYCIRLAKLTGRLLMAECCHNTRGTFDQTIKALTELIRQEDGADPRSGDWADVGIRIAVLFGIFGELIREGIADFERRVDISLVAGDFSGPMSVWYARKMGLPIGNIVCCCNENGSLWDFICHGQLRTDSVARDTLIPEADVAVPVGIERLIHACGGTNEVMRYLEAVHSGKTYYLDDRMLRAMRQGIYVTVNSSGRIRDLIPNIWGTYSVLMAPCAALCHAGLQDYQARTGESRCALILSGKSPRFYGDSMARLLGISSRELEDRL